MATLGDIATGLIGVLSDPDEEVRISATSGLTDICQRSPDVGLGACVDFLANNSQASATSTSHAAVASAPRSAVLTAVHVPLAGTP